MPRNPKRGGARQGTTGKAYSNRSDLNGAKTLPVQTPPSQQYGQGAQMQASQQAVPLPNGNTPPPAVAAPAQAAPFNPGAASLTRGTERPMEPATTGMPIGPGAGPEALGPFTGDDTGIKLRALYQMSPNPDLADLIEVFEANRG